MTTAYFSNIQDVLLSNIISAKKNITVAVAWFTNPLLFDCLNKLINQGVIIQLILSDDIINFSDKNISFQDLIDRGVEIYITRLPNMMHHKFCIVDERLIISGSYNWTLAAEKVNFENIIVSNDLNLVNQFSVEFGKLKERAEKLKQISMTKFNSYMTELEKSCEMSLMTTELKNDVEILYNSKKETELSDEVKSQFEKAELHYLRGNHQNAIDLCESILEKNPNTAKVFELIAASKWRQKKFKEQIEFATKAIEVDNLYYPAYNTLAIGYANIRNATKSIENYQICINAEPEEYVYYRNRGISYLELEMDFKIQKKLRNQFAKKANSDFEKVIELTNKLEQIKPHYGLFYSRGVAYLNLNRFAQAKNDFLKALDEYGSADKMEQDSHHLKEIKYYLKNIEKFARG